MGDRAKSGGLSITSEWLLRQVPAVSFFCENDPHYTMRLLIGGSGTAFGYDLDDFIDNRSYYAASAPHPDDLDIVDAHAEFAVENLSPAVSRIRLLQADSSEVQVLLVSRGVRNAEGKVVGIAGAAVDLSLVPVLEGDSALLSAPADKFKPRPPVSEVNYRSADWLIDQLPLLTFFTENDAVYTVRRIGGSLEELLGYSAADFIDANTYKPATTIYPPDQDIGDAYVSAAGGAPGALSAARLRLVHLDGHETPALIVARGAQPEGNDTGAAGVVLDLTNVEALQGNPGLLTMS